MYLLYNISLYLATFLGFPLIFYKLRTKGKHKVGLGERLGVLPREVKDGLQDRAAIWLHAVSVGEVMAALPLAREIKRAFPGWKLVVSTVTVTGNRTAREKMATLADHILFFPFDYRWAVKRAIEAVHPRLFIAMETELWPNFFRCLAGKGIPSLLANGRISADSFRGYRLARPLMEKVLSQIDLFSMQTELDAQRIVALGANRHRVRVSGNVKFDQALALRSAPPAEIQRLRQLLSSREGSPLMIAGSTHRGEEEKVVATYEKVRGPYPDLCLLIAPRHIERVREVEELLGKWGLPVMRRTALPEGFRWSQLSPRPILLLDSLGELAYLYEVATVVFVGGSLVPSGGQNLLEPAVHGKPVLFGPHVDNFLEISRILKENGGGIQVQDEAELAAKIMALLDHPQRLRELGQKASQAVIAHQGAVAKHLQLISELLEGQ